eukprot:6196634-Pleurochrysis_carterae.AAC.2
MRPKGATLSTAEFRGALHADRCQRFREFVIISTKHDPSLRTCQSYIRPNLEDPATNAECSNALRFTVVAILHFALSSPRIGIAALNVACGCAIFGTSTRSEQNGAAGLAKVVTRFKCFDRQRPEQHAVGYIQACALFARGPLLASNQF